MTHCANSLVYRMLGMLTLQTMGQSNMSTHHRYCHITAPKSGRCVLLQTCTLGSLLWISRNTMTDRVILCCPHQ